MATTVLTFCMGVEMAPSRLGMAKPPVMAVTIARMHRPATTASRMRKLLVRKNSFNRVPPFCRCRNIPCAAVHAQRTKCDPIEKGKGAKGSPFRAPFPCSRLFFMRFVIFAWQSDFQPLAGAVGHAVERVVRHVYGHAGSVR